MSYVLGFLQPTQEIQMLCASKKRYGAIRMLRKLDATENSAATAEKSYGSSSKTSNTELPYDPVISFEST